jgi:endonuclease G, mitochondrial
MKFISRLLSLSIVASFFIVSCKKSIDVELPPVADTTSSNISAPLLEAFETGIKPGFNKAYTQLWSGLWLFEDASIGTSTLDKKRGEQSARLQGNGSIAMKFDVVNGAKMIVVASASFDVNPSSGWQLWVSENSGASYYQVGNTIATTAALKNDTFLVNIPSTVRISIRKVSGGANAINVDDITISNQLPQVVSNNDDYNMLMGNPSNATTDVVNANNYLMDKGYYILSYSRDRGIPNWVSWHLQSSDIGSASRQDDFRSDPDLPPTFYHVSNTSYSGSGFDRGHNCPSADRSSSVAANSATFLMTNMIPQAPYNNQQTWANLEDYSRTLVQQGNELFIIMGNYGVGGTGSNGSANTINNGNVTVPSNIWKVIVVLPSGSNDLKRVTSSTRVIAVITPNINTISSNWKTYRTSIDAIENATGYDLLSNVPASVQQVLEATVDNQ